MPSIISPSRASFACIALLGWMTSGARSMRQVPIPFVPPYSSLQTAPSTRPVRNAALRKLKSP